ncbi:MAG: hypothetical protein JXR56_08085 [Candidatus Cloacimonetes bacterium]|nr:hypothetical protein [Candidatus Cloacimonadota bacterium]
MEQLEFPLIDYDFDSDSGINIMTYSKLKGEKSWLQEVYGFYMQYQDKAEKANSILDYATRDFYRDKAEEIKTFIAQHANLEGDYNSFAAKCTSSVYQAIYRLMNWLEKNCPELHAHLTKTLTFGANLIYEPHKDTSIILLIKE